MNFLVFGEVLYDVYPLHKKIGGAPLNFGAHSARLGAVSSLFSAVGNDKLGEDIISEVAALGVKTDFCEILDDVSSGVCLVTYNGDLPIYDLKSNVSYDNISYNSDIEKEKFDLIYFGTLALRSEKTYAAWKKLMVNSSAKERFLDLNLRGSFYSEALIREVLREATSAKLNRDEYLLCREIFKIKSDGIREFSKELCSLFGLELLIVTLDKDGAAAYCAERDEFVEMPARKGVFVSAVGAGDSFSACFMYNYLSGAPIEKCMEKATALAALVVSKEAAIPEYNGAEFKA